MASQVALNEVDGVEIISLADNTVDFLSTIERKEVDQVREWVKNRMDEEWMRKHFRLPFAEHGYSILIKVFSEGSFHSILFDTGVSREGVVTNARRMGLNLWEVECIVLSHGHYDHFGGLVGVLKVIAKKLPIIVHENMFKIRGVVNPDGTIRKYPKFPREDQVAPAKYLRTKQPHLLADASILVTGEIPRKTDFEKGFPRQRVFSDGSWQPDPWIWDDRAIIINVKRKGLVVISGCAHAGIVNTTLYAQQITGVAKVHAIMGGFHLAGKECEPRISRTVEALQKFRPKIVVPSHCTGWRGKYTIFEAMPRAFVWNSVGNLYRF
ncbi:MAG: MBL fold metallo-hydrolase [Candidatus Bathyarchaeota archaeon]|nr:MBL fold metallo-hydrolase [Candidatus Bathyarchaeota archaeon]MDH5662850.1 MBL fold metallo-hydrolase [Candidatus Bathyarchaeota archaeon]